MRSMDGDRALNGLSVLVLEDEILVALLIEQALADAGCRVAGPVATVAAAMALLATRPVDLALLDICLGRGQTGYAVAAALAARHVPFAFVTGYGTAKMDPRYRDRPALQKPFHAWALRQILLTLAGTPEYPA